MGNITTRDGTTKKLERGFALIINNRIFDNPVLNRLGSEYDVDVLETLLPRLKCIEVEKIIDKDKDEILGGIRDCAASWANKNPDFLVVVVMTHGHRKGQLVTKDGNIYLTSDVWQAFEKHGEYSKIPKFFIFQACRGSECGQKVSNSSPGPLLKDLPAHTLPNLPRDNLTFISCSTSEHQISSRTKNGTVYIQEICYQISILTKQTNLLDVFTNVTQHITNLTFTKKKDGSQFAQTPTLHSFLGAEIELKNITIKPNRVTESGNASTVDATGVLSSSATTFIENDNQEDGCVQTSYNMQKQLKCIIFYDASYQHIARKFESTLRKFYDCRLSIFKITSQSIQTEFLTKKLQRYQNMSGVLMIFLTTFELQSLNENTYKFQIVYDSGKKVEVTKVLSTVTTSCPEFISKPKLLFIVDPEPDGIMTDESMDVISPAGTSFECNEYSDILVYFGKGRSLTNALLSELNKQNNRGILSTLTWVNAENKDPQISSNFQSTLRFPVVFKRKEITNGSTEEVSDENFNNLPKTTTLHELVSCDDLEEDEILDEMSLNENCDIDTQNNKGDTVLHVAAKNRLMKIVNYLLKKNANFLILNRDYEIALDLLDKNSLEVDNDFLNGDTDIGTKLRYAVENNRCDVLLTYVKRGEYLNIGLEVNETILKFLIANNMSHALKYLIEHTECLNTDAESSQNNLVDNAIFFALKHANDNIVKLLVEHEVNVNGIDKNGDSVLHFALKIPNINIELIKYLIIQNDIDVNVKNKDGESVLLYAATHSCSVDIVRELIKRGADVNACDKNGNSILHLTVASSKHDITSMLLTSGANVNAVNKDGNSVLYAAVTTRNLALLLTLFKYNVDVNTINNEKISILQHAVLNSTSRIVEKLIGKGADVHHIDSEGFNILHTAIIHGKLDVIDIIFESNPNVNVVDKYGNSLLCSAIKHCPDEQVAKKLIKRDVNIDHKNAQGDSVLKLAIINKKFETVRVLLAKNVDIHTVDFIGDSILKLAVQYCSAEIVQEIVNKGAKINGSDKDGIGHLRVALEVKNFEAAIILIKAGIHVNGFDIDGNSLLKFAILHGTTEIVRLMIERKANVVCVDMNGNNALQVAKGNGKDEIVELLNSGIMECK